MMDFLKALVMTAVSVLFTVLGFVNDAPTVVLALSLAMLYVSGALLGIALVSWDEDE